MVRSRPVPRWHPSALLGAAWRRRDPVDPLLRLALESASPGLALLDQEDRLLAWNPDLARLCGPTLPLHAGMPLRAFLAPSVRATALTALADGAPVEAALAAAGEPQMRFERRPARTRGIGALLRVAPVVAEEGSLRNAVAARLQSVGALAGGIAHDFNNLLAAIVASAEEALERDPQGEASAELRQVLDSAVRGAALVRQLLAFARQQALQPRVVELNDAVAAMVGLLQRLLGRRIRLSVELEQPGRRVRIDPTQLDQVIMNLALNARDAMPEGGSLRIATGHAVVLRPEPVGQEELAPGRYVLLEVSDTGGGIPPAALPRIFEPFFTTKREQGGSGLGLSTVHGIVRQSGGFIAAESRQGQGTTFRIWLPRHDGAAEPAAPDPRAVPSRAAPQGATCILLVEDEPALLRLAAQALRRAGFEVVPAGSAEEALELVETGTLCPAALVSDVVMPGLDGFALAARLRARNRALPVLLVSGYAEAALGRDLSAEKLRLLAKPYRLADLVAETVAILPAEQAEVS